ncbi:hypothetical protein N0V88_000789 [Collariella sp. IMI 366227]|nr:hypothetical protein N0V88_000789 [Collariella sp. IMI 366227]
MRLAEITTRALLSGLAMHHLEIIPESSPNPAGLLIRQSGCSTGEVNCGTGCAPGGSVCCSGRKAYCERGYYCMPVTGCCPTGKTCSGTPGACDADEAPCNTGCMPANGVCCPTGGYCEPGYTCTANGKCSAGSGGSGGYRWGNWWGSGCTGGK